MNNENMMHFALCTDKNYFMPCGIVMISICENHKNIPICFHIVLTNEEEQTPSTKELEDIVKRYGQKLNIYEIKADDLADFKCNGLSYISTSAFTRLLLADIIPIGISRIIYLDCDTIVDGSLLQMWNTKLPKGCCVGAVRDAFGTLAIQHAAIGTSVGIPYVNSGVLLIDLDLWRTENYSKKCAELARHKKYPLLDEDVLNDLFQNNIFLLPFQYNLQVHFYVNNNVNWAVETSDLPELKQALKKPIIIHYVSRIKPWNSLACLKREVWEKYYNLSSWKSTLVLDYNASASEEFDLLLSKEKELSKYETKLFVYLFRSLCDFYECVCRMRNRKKIVNAVSKIIMLLTCFFDKIYNFNFKRLNKKTY